MAGKVKTIFARDEIAHIWVYGRYHNGKEYVEVTEGRTATYASRDSWRSGYKDAEKIEGNQSFKDDKFYSYSSQIAQRYDLGEQGILYLVYTGHNSLTTKAQVSMLWSAIPSELNGRKVSKFEFSYDERGYHYWPENVQDADTFSHVLDYYITQAREQCVKAQRSRNYRKWAIYRAKGYVITGREFADLLGREKFTQYGALTNAWDNIVAVPEYTPAPPNPNKREYISKWDKAYELLPNLPMIFVRAARGETYELDKLGIKVEDKKILWALDEQLGRKCTISLKLSDSPWATIRVIGEQVITSQGARLGKDEAIKLYEAMLEVVAKVDKTYLQQPIQAGGYSVQYHNNYRWKGHSCNRTIRVGCHYFHPSTIVSDYLSLLGFTMNYIYNSPYVEGLVDYRINERAKQD